MEDEFRYLNMSFKSRGPYFDEAMKVMRALWQEGPSSFRGEFFNFTDAFSYPKPSRQGGPPIWIGGSSDSAIERAAKLGDGWQPGNLSPSELKEGVEKLNQSSGGKKITISLRQTVEISPGASPVCVNQNGKKQFRIAGSLHDILGQVGDYKDAGLQHLLCEFDEIERSEKVDYELFRRNFEVFAKEVIPSLR